MPFDERETVDTVLTYLTKQLGITIHVEEAPAGIAKAQELGEQAMSQGYDAATIAAAEPGEPKGRFFVASQVTLGETRKLIHTLFDFLPSTAIFYNI